MNEKKLKTIKFIGGALTVAALCGGCSFNQNAVTNGDSNGSASSGETSNKNIHDGYRVVGEEELYKNKYAYDEIISPAFSITRAKSDAMTTPEWLAFLAENMELVSIARDNDDYEGVDLTNCDSNFFKSILSPSYEEFEFEFEYGDGEEGFTITAYVYFKDGKVDKRFANGLIGSESGFFLRDEDSKVDHYPNVFANVILHSDQLSETITK